MFFLTRVDRDLGPYEASQKQDLSQKSDCTPGYTEPPSQPSGPYWESEPVKPHQSPHMVHAKRINSIEDDIRRRVLGEPTRYTQVPTQ